MITNTATILFSVISLFILSNCQPNKNAEETPLTRDQIRAHKKDSLSQIKVPEESIVFVGNSIIQRLEVKKLHKEAYNFGIGGDKVSDVLERIDPILNSKPKQLFIEVGTNDLRLDKSNESLITNYNKLIEKIKEVSPETSIYIISILPVSKERGLQREIIEANKRLAFLADKYKATYIDLYSKMQEGGYLKPSYTWDGLHLTEEGYQVWYANLATYLETF